MKSKHISLLLLSITLGLFSLNSYADPQEAAHDCPQSNSAVPNDVHHQGVLDLTQAIPALQHATYKLEDIHYLHDKLGWMMVIHDNEE